MYRSWLRALLQRAAPRVLRVYSLGGVPVLLRCRDVAVAVGAVHAPVVPAARAEFALPAAWEFVTVAEVCVARRGCLSKALA